MLAITGDSAAGKTTLVRGLVAALGADRVTALCTDDYLRHDRGERAALPVTALHPDAHHIAILEQHLQLLATGRPVLKPVYDHGTGRLTRPELVEPAEFVIAEGLLALHTRLSRACFDLAIHLDPSEGIRREWKIRRDVRSRGCPRAAVLAELDRCEPDAAAFVRPQRAYADIVVRFAPVAGRHDPPDTPLSAEILLRPTVGHPDLDAVLDRVDRWAAHPKLLRDTDGRPVDALHVHGHAPHEDGMVVAKALWSALGTDAALPEALGALGDGRRSDPLAITQLLILHHLLDTRR